MIKIARIQIAGLLLVLLPLSASAGVSKPRRVIRVSDVDTIVVEGIAERLRLIGVDGPEVRRGKGNEIISVEPCGREAWAFLDEELRGQSVRLEQHGFDRWGRRLVYAWRVPRPPLQSESWFVNLEVIQSGYATVLRDSKIPGPASRRARFEAAESTAKLGTPVFCSPVPVPAQ